MSIFLGLFFFLTEKTNETQRCDAEANHDTRSRPDSVSSCLPAWFPMLVRSAAPTLHTRAD